MACGQVVMAQRLVISICPLFEIADGVGGAQITDVFQSFFDQIVGRQICALHIINQNRITGKLFKIRIQNNHGNLQPGKRLEVFHTHLCTQQDNPLTVFLGKLLYLRTDILVLIKIGNLEFVAFPLAGLFDAFGQQGKERRVRDDSSVLFINNI